MYSIDEMVDICVKGDVVTPANAEYLRRNLEEFMSYDMPAIVKKVQQIENTMNKIKELSKNGLSQDYLALMDTIYDIHQLVSVTCKQPE